MAGSSVKAPFLINSLKHHISYVRNIVLNRLEINKSALVNELNKGGNLLCDYYFGTMSLEEIVEDIEIQLDKLRILSQESYRNYIHSKTKHYFNLCVRDGSEWTLLKGDSLQRYIHIHPARYSSHTIRVRFLALKTAILLKYLYGSDKEHISYESINYVRSEWLNESPIKAGSNISHILKIIGLFDDHL